MNNNWYNAPASAAASGLDIVRITVALILAIHAGHGLFDPEGMIGFGKYLSSVGFPFGAALVWAIVLIQILSSTALIVRRLIVPACVCQIVILVSGIWLIHFHHGWFVVGDGRNGMEFSVTLIACLFAVLWAYWPRR